MFVMRELWFCRNSWFENLVFAGFLLLGQWFLMISVAFESSKWLAPLNT
jgi:hypothetical protein